MANTTDKLSQLMALANRLNVHATPVIGKDGSVCGLSIDLSCPAYPENLPVLRDTILPTSRESIHNPGRPVAPSP